LERLNTIVDTVVIRYFLLVEEEDLLLNLLGQAVAVPRVIYDPEEDNDVPELARSEITRSIATQQRNSRDLARDREIRVQAERNATRLLSIHRLHADSLVIVLDLTEEELRIVSSLTSPSGCQAFGLKFPLGAGEAACLAIAVSRNYVLATDDNDALKALASMNSSYPYIRIRRMLIDAFEKGLIAKDEANRIHSEMRRLGFRDSVPPFE